jgi:hypothetical protein
MSGEAARPIQYTGPTAGILYTLKRFRMLWLSQFWLSRRLQRSPSFSRCSSVSGISLPFNGTRIEHIVRKRRGSIPLSSLVFVPLFRECRRTLQKIIGTRGPTLDELELDKQLASYSDCYDKGGKCV